MFLSPRFPRDAVVQRQILEGVHGVIELDYNAQLQGKISIQVFSRLANASVLYEQYQHLDPPTAAELVIREKAKSTQSTPSYAPSGYGHPSYPPDTVPAAGYGYPYPHVSAPHPQAQPAAPAPDLASMVGNLDNAALQALLASLQPSQAAPAYQGVPASMPTAGGAQAPQIDLNALLGNLRNTATNQTMPPAGYGGAANYGSSAYMQHGGNMMSPTNASAGIGFGGGDTAQQVQTIMEQLKRATQ